MTKYRERLEAGEFQGSPTPAGPDLDAMSKAELIEHARDRGISPANADMTKADLIDVIKAAS